jgi:release factor glutamine methyltransferase
MSLPSPPTIVAALRAAGCVYAEAEADLLLAAAATAPELDDLLARRVAGEPLEHVLGWVEFCGLRIAVAPGVFVPRRRTEALVAEAVARARPGCVVLDLCCGSGAVGAAVRAAVPDVVLHSADVDPAAVACARRNLPGAAVHLGDLYDAVPEDLRGRVTVLVANAPYVPTSALGLMPPEARDHEPPQALDGGDDGLAVLRRIVAGAGGWLSPGGALLFETSAAQAGAATQAVRAAGLRALVVTDDERGGTVVVGTR